MHKSLTWATLTAILTTTTSAGTYYIDNYCPFPLYLQSTSTPSVSPAPLVVLQPSTVNAYSEVMRDAGYSINALTISRTPDLSSPMQATYHQTTEGPTPGFNFYALSEIFGTPLLAEGFQLLAQPDGFGPNCPPRSPGQACPFIYGPLNPAGNDPEAVFYENDLEDLRLLLCLFNQNGTADAPA